MLIFTHRIDREFESFGWTATTTMATPTTTTTAAAEGMWNTVYWGKQINNYCALIIQIMTFPVETIRNVSKSENGSNSNHNSHVYGKFKTLLFRRPNELTRIYFRQLFVFSTFRFHPPPPARWVWSHLICGYARDQKFLRPLSVRRHARWQVIVLQVQSAGYGVRSTHTHYYLNK